MLQQLLNHIVGNDLMKRKYSVRQSRSEKYVVCLIQTEHFKSLL